jgi:hypothetical protein
MLTLDLVGQAILLIDAVALIWAAWWAWRQGRSNGGTLTRGAAFVASLGFAATAAIVVYGLMQ